MYAGEEHMDKLFALQKYDEKITCAYFTFVLQRQ